MQVGTEDTETIGLQLTAIRKEVDILDRVPRHAADFCSPWRLTFVASRDA
ncbi:MAG: hypothetical protein ACOYMN_15465 [Roseimicrobium sp.]